jgi:hypothetical protein
MGLRTLSVEALLGALARENGRNGLQQDLEIEEKIPVVNVIQIELEPFGKWKIASAGNLPQAGKTRHNTEPFALDASIELIDISKCHGPGSHKAHFTFQDVEQLR